MLLTEWKTIGTAGETIDGRKISDQDLKDAAETYDPEEYTAVLNSDHALSWYGSFGHVHQVRLSTDKKDRTILQAKISPNKRLLEMNSQGQRVFFSMELMDNFAGSGKTYLSGLALTDQPASLGTSILKFSSKHKDNDVRFSKPEELHLDFDSGEDGKAMEGFFSRMFSVFLKNDPNARRIVELAGNDPDPVEDESSMDKKQFEELKGVQEKTLEALNGLTEAVKSFKPEQEEETPPPPATEETPDPKEEPETSKDFSALKDTQEKTLEAINNLTEAFKALKQEAPAPKPPAGNGSAEDKQFQVL